MSPIYFRQPVISIAQATEAGLLGSWAPPQGTCLVPFTGLQLTFDRYGNAYLAACSPTFGVPPLRLQGQLSGLPFTLTDLLNSLASRGEITVDLTFSGAVLANAA